MCNEGASRQIWHSEPRGRKGELHLTMVDAVTNSLLPRDGMADAQWLPAVNAPIVVATIMRPLETNGMQTHIREFSKYLSRRGMPPLIVTPFSWGKLFIFPVFGLRRVLSRLNGPLGVYWYRKWHYEFLKRALERVLARTGPAVIYAQCPLSARAALDARAEGQRVVMVVHFYETEAIEWAETGDIIWHGRSWQHMGAFEREVMHAVDGVVYVSRAGKQKLLNPPPPTTPSLSISNFLSAPRTGSTRRCADLVTVGRLFPTKNHQYLLEILRAARFFGHTYTLDIFGDGPCRKDLERRASELGIGHQVRFHGSHTNMVELLAGYRAYVHVATRENQPLAIIEAMGCGCPVISSAVGGIPELFTSGVEGLSWPLDDPQEAARVLISLLEDEVTRQQMAEAARKRFEQHYDVSVVGPQLLKFFASLRRQEGSHDA